jgi:hypothetical protein
MGLPIVDREGWDDGTIVTWLGSPFPIARKPIVPSRLHLQAKRKRVTLSSLIGTQDRVTENGVKRYMSDAGDELPMVYKYRGELFIADGHHRLVAAWLRGNKTAVVRVVEVPDRE